MLDRIFRSTIYIRIKPDLVTVLHAETGKELQDIPALAIEEKQGKKSILAVGKAARSLPSSKTVTITNGFQHPRTLIADFTVAQQVLRYFMAELGLSTIYSFHNVVIHPQSHLEGGLTQIEIRALAELGYGVGAKKVFVWEGRDLAVSELKNRDFAGGGGKLLFP
jgi:rod shape-determining protein MreB